MIKNVILSVKTKYEFVYKVEKNESVEDIAKKFSVPLCILKGFNKIEKVSEFERIIIPKVEGIRYKVQPFESLSDIAKKFGKSEEFIKNKNFITEIYAMQEIIV